MSDPFFLGSRKDLRAVAPLIDILSRVRKIERYYVIEALNNITGLDLGKKAKKWKKWWKQEQKKKK